MQLHLHGAAQLGADLLLEFSFGHRQVMRHERHDVELRRLGARIDMEAVNRTAMARQIGLGFHTTGITHPGGCGDAAQCDGQRHRKYQEGHRDQQCLPRRVLRRVLHAEAIPLGNQGHAQGNGQQVRHEQEERIAGNRHAAHGQAITHHRQRRHQRGGNGHADDGLALAGNRRIGARQPREHRDHQIEQGRLGTRQDFAGGLADRRRLDDEVGHQQRQQGADQQRDQGATHHPEVDDAQREPQLHDRSHQRRDQHRADHHRRRRLQQAEDGDAAGHHRHEQIARCRSAPIEHVGYDGIVFDTGNDVTAAPSAGTGQERDNHSRHPGFTCTGNDASPR
ncbi:hypothetical protein D3C71_1028560 [compost metagenome]